jgi:hypothetical protein
MRGEQHVRSLNSLKTNDVIYFVSERRIHEYVLLKKDKKDDRIFVKPIHVKRQRRGVWILNMKHWMKERRVRRWP